MNTLPRTETRARIAVLLANAENRRLLGQTLRDRYDVVTEIDRTLGFDERGPFDLCIVDELSVRGHENALAFFRRSYDPVYLPVLLLADRRTTDLRSGRLWDIVDDVLFRPVERIELSARVEALLRTRALSLRAQRMTSLYEHERLVAQRLQDAALPNLPTELAGLRLDAVYRPADDASRVGGDWFDALRLPDGRIVVTIGDVSGSGLDAAVTMSQMRHVLRAVANVHSDPALMIDAAERTLTGADSYRQLTCFVGVIDLVSEEITFACAGHPPPLLRDARGNIEALACDGMMLGTSIRIPRDAMTADFEPGAMLVLYTDGVTEAERDPIAGEEKLIAATSALAKHDPRPATTLADAMRVSSANDDVALLTVSYAAGDANASLRRWSFDARDSERAREVQEEFRIALVERNFTRAATALAQTVLAELLGNVVRHAPGLADVVLDADGSHVVLNVLDRGPGFAYFPKLPQDPLAERGRGIFIVSRLVEEFSVHRRRRAGSHARAVLR